MTYEEQFVKNLAGSLKERFDSKRSKKLFKNYHEAAKNGRLLFDILGSNSSADSVVRSDLRTLRARSRTLAENNEYVAGFIKKAITNVVGVNGILLQSKVKNSKGKIDSKFNTAIEDLWKKFCKREHTSINGLDSFIGILKLAIRHLITDGEILVRILKGKFINQFGFSLQVIEADCLDIEHNLVLSDGNVIRMGVEIDQWGKPVAYWLFEKHPEALYDMDTKRNNRVRISAEEIIHLFVRERASQNRGLPWLSSAILRLHMLGSYEEAALVASRVGASQMGFFVNGVGAQEQQYMGDDTDEAGSPINEVAPGQLEKLPSGWDFKSFNPQYPHEAFMPFTKSMLRGIAASLGISYNSLASDLESTSYSSMRSGALEERDQWSMIQKFIVDNLVRPIAEGWIKQLGLTSLINFKYPYDQVIESLEYQPKTWAWVDPRSEMAAKAIELENRITSRSKICKEAGYDYEDILRDLAEEKLLQEQYGIKEDIVPVPVTQNPVNKDVPAVGG